MQSSELFVFEQAQGYFKSFWKSTQTFENWRRGGVVTVVNGGASI
jgi:hypothetical protein